MILREYIFLIVLCLPVVGFSQSYIKDVNDLDSLQSLEKKPVVLFFTAEWCKYCRAMESEMFSDDSITSLLQEEFYFVQIEEKLKKEIIFADTSYQYVPTGIDSGYHEFSSRFALKDGSLSYPTITILWKGKELLRFSSYLDSDDFKEVLNKVVNTVKH